MYLSNFDITSHVITYSDSEQKIFRWWCIFDTKANIKDDTKGDNFVTGFS